MGYFKEILEDNPVIAALRDVKYVEDAAQSSSGVIFMLCGSILNIEEVVVKLKNAGKCVCVHIDLVEGLGRDSAAVTYLKRAGVDGIITTRPSLIKDARLNGLFAVQRLFIVDSRSLETGIRSVQEEGPDAVEIMPGAASKIIGRIHERVHIPVIAGGLIWDRSDVYDALSNGAVSVSTTEMSLWND